MLSMQNQITPSTKNNLPTEIILPTENFELSEANKLFEDSPSIEKIVTTKTGKKVVIDVPNISKCEDLIKQYFFPMKNGSHFIWDNQRFEHLSKDTVKDVYFNRLPKEINEWYFKKYYNLYEAISDIHKPLIQNNGRVRQINLCSGVKWKQTKKYVDFPVEVKKKVDIFLTYMKEVVSGNDDKTYQYLLKWYSNVCKGKKNDTLLYNKGPEGIGKSTIMEMMTKYVLGNGICVRNAPVCVIKGENNKLLLGKLFVVFEELPTFSSTEWNVVSGKLKSLITETLTTYADKYEKLFQAVNINNYVINTNVDALKHSDGRRIFVVPFSIKRQGDHKYFGDLNTQCFNDAVGEALYFYLTEIDTTNFQCQRDMPETQEKLNSIVDSLEIPFQFIKSFVLTEKPIKATIGELYQEYEHFCVTKDKHALSKTKFNAKLAEVNIKWKASNGKKVYKYSHEALKAIAENRKWLHILDDDIAPAKQKKIEYLFGEEHEPVTVNKNTPVVCDLDWKVDEKIEVQQKVPTPKTIEEITPVNIKQKMKDIVEKYNNIKTKEKIQVDPTIVKEVEEIIFFDIDNLEEIKQLINL